MCSRSIGVCFGRAAMVWSVCLPESCEKAHNLFSNEKNSAPADNFHSNSTSPSVMVVFTKVPLVGT